MFWKKTKVKLILRFIMKRILITGDEIQEIAAFHSGIEINY